MDNLNDNIYEQLQNSQFSEWPSVMVFLVINLVLFIANFFIQKNKEEYILHYEKVQDRVIQAGYEMFNVMVDSYMNLNNKDDDWQDTNKIMSQLRHNQLFLSVRQCEIVEDFYNQIIIFKNSSDLEKQQTAGRKITQGLYDFKKEFHKKKHKFNI